MRTMARKGTVLAGLVLVGALACSGDPTAAPGDNPVSTLTRNGAPGGDSGGSGPTLAISPRMLTMTVGATGSLVAVDPNGTIITSQATWRSSNVAIVAAGAAGVVTGKAAGTVFVYATFNGHTDSATVAVVGDPRP